MKWIAASMGRLQNYNWSPDSKWLAYDKNVESGFSVVYLYGLADRKITAVTSNLNNSYGAVFDPDKRYLYFLSDRDYNEVLGNIDFEFANPKTTRVYVVTLTADEPSPFPALSDEVKVKSEEPAEGTPEARPRRTLPNSRLPKRRRNQRRKKKRSRPRPRSLRRCSRLNWMASRIGSLRWRFHRR